MKKLFLIALVFVMLPCASHALIKAGDSNLGKTCFDDDNAYVLIKCTTPGALASQNYYYCSSSYEETVNDDSFVGNLHCIVDADNRSGVYSKNFYVCTTEYEPGIMWDPCLEVQKAAFKDTPLMEFDWIYDGDGRMYREVYTCSEGQDTARYVHALSCTSSREYVCDSGYYKSGGSGASMMCDDCPGAGTTPEYNTVDIKGCYIPRGRSFNDETGSGSYTNNCHYSI